MTPQLVGISKMIYLLVNYQVNTLFEKLKSLGYDIEPQNQVNYLNNSKPLR